MKSIKSHLTFNRSQRDGIFLLILFIIGLLGLLLFVDFRDEKALDISSPDIVMLQKKFDSLKQVRMKTSQQIHYPFNPNFISEFKAYSLGMSASEFERLKNYREQGKWINTAMDFKKVTEVPDSLFKIISPFFKFPDWVTNPGRNRQPSEYRNIVKSFEEKIDLNLATAGELQKVFGVGETLSKRIIAYKDKLGGFNSDLQLYNVYGLNEAVVEKILREFTVKTPSAVNRYNINTASASDLATIPGISFELAKRIWEFRILRDKIADLAELEKIDGISDKKLRLIAVYLYAE